MAKQIKRIAIVGGGVSGLSAIAAFKEIDGFEPVCFEKTDSFGGTWCYREETEEGVPSLMPTTVANSSKEIGAFSNFPPKKECKKFMTHQEFYKYITEYVLSKDLLSCIKCNTDVVSIKKHEDYEKTGKWIVTIHDRITKNITYDVYDGVIICVGHLNRPKMPSYPEQYLFKGQIIHSHSLKSFEPYRNQTVVIVGMGCSGSDAAVETSKVAKRVYLSTRSGAYVTPRTGPYGLPYDYLFLRQCYDYFFKLFPLHFVSWILETFYLKLRLSDNTYKVKPVHHLLYRDPILNDYINDKLSSGQVTQKPDVKSFTEEGILFQGDTEPTEVDAVIMATGYTYKFPFLEEGIITQENGIINLYKCMFPIHLPYSTLAVIGFVCPFGPGIPIVELQCRYAAQILSGKCKLPSHENMLKEVKDKYKYNLSTSAPSEKTSLRVNFIQYSNELASEIGAKPNLLKILLKDVRLFVRLLFGPSLPYQFRLQGPGRWEGARKALFESKSRMRPGLTENSKSFNEHILRKFIRKIVEFFFL